MLFYEGYGSNNLNNWKLGAKKGKKQAFCTIKVLVFNSSINIWMSITWFHTILMITEAKAIHGDALSLVVGNFHFLG